MYEAYGTYVDDKYFDNHDDDDDTDDDTDNNTGDDTDDDIYANIIIFPYKIPKASFKRVPGLGTSPGPRVGGMGWGRGGGGGWGCILIYALNRYTPSTLPECTSKHQPLMGGKVQEPER